MILTVTIIALLFAGALFAVGLRSSTAATT